MHFAVPMEACVDAYLGWLDTSLGGDLAAREGALRKRHHTDTKGFRAGI